MSLDCLNETIRFDNATLQSVEATQSFIGWFIGNCVLSVSLVANGWLLAVSWGTTHIDGIFKYPVCYLAFCDVLVAVVRIARPTLHVFADASTYLHYCAVPYALMVGAGNAMLGALIPTPLQRCLMFVEVPWLSDHAQRPRSILMFCAVLFILSVLPPFGTILAPPSRCLDGALCPQLPVSGLFLVATRVPPVLSYIAAIGGVSLFIWKVKEITSFVEQLAVEPNVTPPSSEMHLNRDLQAMVIVQTFNPILLTAPTMIILVGRMGGYTITPMVFRLAAGVFQLNPLVDALSAIYFIKPYRHLAQKTAKHIRQILCKPNTVHPTPAVVVNVAPANQAQPNND